MSTPSCHTCKRTLRVGESAYVADWKVLDILTSDGTVHIETRYTCDDCHVAE
jgi:hypothetical protein